MRATPQGLEKDATWRMTCSTILSGVEAPDVSRDDDFFHLGGDSLRGAIVGAQVYAALGIELNLGAIADHPTIAGLAAFIDAGRGSHVASTEFASIPPVVRVSRAESMPLSFFQEHIWFNCRNADGTHLRSHQIIGPLNIEILKECLSYLSDRYEILRTTFGMVEGHPAQIIHPSSPLDFSYIDRWYERHSPERIGPYELYRVELRR